MTLDGIGCHHIFLPVLHIPHRYCEHALIHCCVQIVSMPKKTRPITVLTEEELNALDDATFDELAADEERLNLAFAGPCHHTLRAGPEYC